MKAHLAKVSLALLSTVFLLGCQDMGSGPVGLQAPQFDMPNNDDECPQGRDQRGHCHGAGVNPNLIEALLFLNPAFSCADGATPTGASFGHVGWQTDRIFVGEAALPASDHIHYELQLTGVVAGDYTIFGSQDLNCSGTTGIPTGAVDIGTAKVKKNGKVVTPGALQFEFPKHDAGGLTTHVWVTVSGPGGIFRSPVVTIVIPVHDEV